MDKYQKAQANGESIGVQGSNGVGATIKIVSVDTTLTAADSGKTIILSSVRGEAITLPAVANGLKYKFVVGLAFATTPWTVRAASKVIQGTVIINGASVLGANEDIITFVKNGESVGDWVEIVSNGTNWYISGVGSAANSITLTASS